jgi:hypothetical protein
VAELGWATMGNVSPCSGEKQQSLLIPAPFFIFFFIHIEVVVSRCSGVQNFAEKVKFAFKVIHD